MANEAQKEPTMEEILASIRKIISDDDAPDAPPAAAVVRDKAVVVEDAGNDDDVLSLDEMMDEAVEDVFEEEDLLEDVPDTVADAFEADDPFEETAFAEPEPAPEPEPVSDPAPQAQAATPPPPAAAPAERTDTMPATQKYEQTVLTEETTADAAAGALGKLISRMDLGGENTIESLVREMLKPMIKEWLDANLPGIVEEKVEAEVQRIARMAR